MRRISSNMNHDNFQFFMKLRESQGQNVREQIDGQTQLNQLRNNPSATAQTVRLESVITRLNQYQKNIDEATSAYTLSEGYMQQSVDMLQRLRELAVQGANGTYSVDDMKQMSTETDQILRELVAVANARNSDGTTLFAGERTDALPFRPVEGHVPGGGVSITGVLYTGDIGEKLSEISQRDRIPINFAGNKVFWAEQQHIYSDVDAQNYSALREGSFFIDGKEIEVEVGDNVHTIIDKINNTNLAVRASIDPVYNSLVLDTTVAHQIWLEEPDNGSTTLKDLGLLSSVQFTAPGNIVAKVSGGDMFDVIIRMRDALNLGDKEALGGSVLSGLDQGMNNLLSNLALLGSRQERADFVAFRVGNETLSRQGDLSRISDVDMAAAISELSMLDFVQKAAFQMAGRTFGTTLMDFLR